MMSEKLKKGRKYMDYMLKIRQDDQPSFHLTGGVGWINDPNGFSVYKGEYHLFYQHHPYRTRWGDIHWGHVKTKDFITWERLPEALAPDQEYDEQGCFSGTAIETPDGKHLLIYTGVSFMNDENGVMTEYQQTNIAIGDGVNYEKYNLNPVIGTDMIPEGNDLSDFRDPKIMYEDGRYYCLMASRGADGSGEILMYESPDAKNWKFTTVLEACCNQYGRMWECPDFFELDGKQVLIVSPQEMRATGLEFHAGYNTAALIGMWNSAEKKFYREYIQSIDYGLDFYAPQTLKATDGRRIMIAWMQNWTTSTCAEKDHKFYGQMTLPRELSIDNGRLIQGPVREIENYYGELTAYHNVYVNGEISLQKIEGRMLDMSVHIRPAYPNSYRDFRIVVAKDGINETSVSFKPDKNKVRVDRTKCGFPYDIIGIRDFLVSQNQGEIDLRIILDRYSMEVFVNGGEQAASSLIYTDFEADGISFRCDGEAFFDVEKHDLKF